MYNIIALIGEAGSGKDRTMQAVLEADPSLHEIISCTTRPMRQGEINGVNYYYYSLTEFKNKINSEEMLEYTIFNNWFYGTSYDSVREDMINIGVFNPDGIKSLLNRNDCNVIVFYITASDKIRLIRQLNREENPDVSEVIRRFLADNNDFDEMPFKYIELKNNKLCDLDYNVKFILDYKNSFK